MNPLCCIAPVSIDRDRTNPLVTKPVIHSSLHYASKSTLSTQDSSLDNDDDGDSKVNGIVYKWVNYGKGWRSMWFVLQHGVLSYYKIRGPDKIFARDRSVRIISDQSVRFLKNIKQ